MKYTEDQLAAFSTPPSKTELEKTKHTADMIKEVLDNNLPVNQIKSANSLSSYTYEVYLQGSYANRTNVSFNSDVDIVVELKSLHGYDISNLTEIEKASYHRDHSSVSYTFAKYKLDILAALKVRFGDDVKESNKCLKIRENASRVNADVVPCFEYRVYKRYLYQYDNSNWLPGIKLYDNQGNMLINYPKLHQKNTRIKQMATNKQFKKQVRIYKTIRNTMVEANIINESVAASYWVENLLYNCTDDCFASTSHTVNMLSCLQFLYDAFENARESGFTCANGQQNLFSDKTWDAVEATNFIQKFGEFVL